jgi:hypothetical protein
MPSYEVTVKYVFEGYEDEATQDGERVAELIGLSSTKVRDPRLDNVSIVSNKSCDCKCDKDGCRCESVFDY